MSLRPLTRYAVTITLAWAASSGSARAETEAVPRAQGDILAADAPRGTDGVYGRFDGDLDLSLAAGPELLRGGPGAAAMFRALYMQTASLYVGYTTSFGNHSAVPPRSLALGVGLRPMFLPRWGNDKEQGPAILDLTLDSMTFDIGTIWAADQGGSFNQKPGIELGLGLEVPLTLQASGPWLGARGALRWRGVELASKENSDPANLGPVIFFTLAWHVLVNAHIVDMGDRLVR
jgi:hypothetical protein